MWLGTFCPYQRIQGLEKRSAYNDMHVCTKPNFRMIFSSDRSGSLPNTLYQQLFPVVHQQEMSAGVPAFNSPSVISPIVTVQSESVVNADSSSAEPTENESVSQLPAEVAVKESSLPEESEGQGSSSDSTSEESVDVSTEEPSVVKAVLDDMTSEIAEAVESVEEPGEPVWPEQLRANS